MMRVEYTGDALRDLRLIGHVAAGRITDKMSVYAAAPTRFVNQVKKLKGDGVLRLRIGDYRVLFTEDGLVLRILRVGHRRDIYR